MKKARKTKSAAKKAASGSAVTGKVSGGVVEKQPQVKQQAALAHGMFLSTDDAWSLRYFDQNDLHCKEREVFG